MNPFFSHRTLDLARQLVRCPSLTPQEAGTFDIVESVLRPLGFHTQRLQINNVCNFYGRRGTRPPHLCFVGHVDVVPPGHQEGWCVNPFEGIIQDNKFWGRGVADMKGAIACFLSALEQNNIPQEGSISLLLTSDEEGPALDGIRQMVPWIQKNHEIPDLYLVGEPTGEGVGNEIKIGRRGSITGALVCKGKQGHIAYPHLAKNPIPPLLLCLQELCLTPLDKGDDLFEPSHLEITSIDVGNTVSNIIPHEAKALFGLRFNTQHTAHNLCQWIEKTCRQHAKEHTLSLQNNGEAYLTRHPFFIETIQKALHHVTGKTPRLSTSGGTTDGRFLSVLGPVIECGLPEDTIHQVNEHVLVDDLLLLTSAYQNILRVFLRTLL